MTFISTFNIAGDGKPENLLGRLRQRGSGKRNPGRSKLTAQNSEK